MEFENYIILKYEIHFTLNISLVENKVHRIYPLNYKRQEEA